MTPLEIMVAIGGAILILYMARNIFKRIESAKRAEDAWRRFAERRNLRPQSSAYQSDTSYIGEYEGYPVVLECLVRNRKPDYRGQSTGLGSDDDVHIYTRIHVTLTDLPAGLAVYPQSFRQKLMTVVGMQDIKTGDDRFDRTFIVKGRVPEQVQQFLNPLRRQQILKYHQAIPDLELHDDGLYVLRKDQVETESELNTLFTRLGALARALAS